MTSGAIIQMNLESEDGMQELDKMVEEICENAFFMDDDLVKEKNRDENKLYISFSKLKKIIFSYLMHDDGWIPVEERLPEDGETVLCTDGKDVYLVEYDADYDAPFGDVDGITHWCYCPEAYQAKQIADQRPEWKDRMLHTFLGGHE